jgi:hypothetical protein
MEPMSFERERERETVMGTSESHGHEVGMKIQDDVVFVTPGPLSAKPLLVLSSRVAKTDAKTGLLARIQVWK